MAGEGSRGPASCSRVYIQFQDAVRLMHQNVNKQLDLRQHSFESMVTTTCREGSGRRDRSGPGWVSITTTQMPDGQGSVAVDISVGSELKESMYAKGSMVANKTVVSVVTTTPQAGGDLISVLAITESPTQPLSITRIDTVAPCRPGGDVSPMHGQEDRRRDRPDKGHEEERRKKQSPATASNFDPANGPQHPLTSVSSAAACVSSPSSSRDPRETREPRDPRTSSKKERRRLDEECK